MGLFRNIRCRKVPNLCRMPRDVNSLKTRANIHTTCPPPDCLMSVNGGLSLAITILMWLLGLGLVLMLGRRLARRLQLSRAKHSSLAGHARWGRRLARLIPYYEYDETQFFRADDAPQEITDRRQGAFHKLADCYAQRFPKTARQTMEVQDEISDLQFTSRYRVPFQFSRYVRRQLSAG